MRFRGSAGLSLNIPLINLEIVIFEPILTCPVKETNAAVADLAVQTMTKTPLV